MSRNAFRAASGLAIILLLVTPLAVFAHAEITAGDYTIEYGWVTEPVIAGQENAIVINVSTAEHSHDEEGGEAHTDESMAAAISITAPADGSTVQGDQVEVTVAIEGLDEQADSHYHLYVDDKMLIMAPIDQPTIIVTNLSNGPHTIKAALASLDHAESGQAATATITVEGSSASGEPSISMLEPDDHGHGEEVAIDVSGLKLEMVYAGETTVLILQPAEGGVPGQFVAPFTPERAGQYTLRITGTLKGEAGETEVNAEVQPEEATPDPNATTATPAQSGGMNTTTLVIIAVVGVLLVAAIIGAVVISRKK